MSFALVIGVGSHIGLGTKWLVVIIKMSGALDDGRDDGDERGVREQDRFLPIANISRIMKKALPPNAKIAKDAKETVQECVSEFISFITSEYALAPSAGGLPRSTRGRSRDWMGSARVPGLSGAWREPWCVLGQGKRQVSAGEEEDDKWGRPVVGHEHPGV